MDLASAASLADQTEIDRMVGVFYRAFDNRGGRRPVVDSLRELFVPQGVIVKNSGAEPEIHDLPGFIEPRRQLLTGGRLLEFFEEEFQSRTDFCGRLAQRLSLYRKSGVLDGAPLAAKGAKVFQFIQTPAGWRITSVAWDDERPGFTLPEIQHFKQ